MNISREKIEIQLARLQLSQKECAERMGISASGLRVAIHRGRTTPRSAGRLAAALGVQVEYILEV